MSAITKLLREKINDLVNGRLDSDSIDHTALILNAHCETAEKGDSQYLLHCCAVMEAEDGRLIGEAVYTRYDAEQAEGDNSSPRFIARPDSYLYRLREEMFDPESRIARLPRLIAEDLERGTGKVVILDDLCLDSELSVSEILDVVSAVILDLGQTADLLLIPNWSQLARRLGAAPMDMLKLSRPFAMVPYNVHTLLGICNQFASQLRQEEERRNS